MNWFYALNGQQAGPVDDAELDRLVQVGTIDQATLVWYSGMAQWQPYAEARRSVLALAGGRAPAAAVAGEGQAQCSQCGQVFPADEVVRVENLNVCALCKPMLLQKLREGVPVRDVAGGALVYAGFWIRFGAVFLDGIGLALFNFLTSLVIVAILGRENALGTNIVVLVLQYSVAITYETYMIGRYGATLGKMACGLRVVEPDGSRVGYGRAFGRYFAKILSAIILGIGYIMAAFDDQKRALHDHICDTRVVVK